MEEIPTQEERETSLALKILERVRERYHREKNLYPRESPKRRYLWSDIEKDEVVKAGVRGSDGISRMKSLVSKIRAEQNPKKGKRKGPRQMKLRMKER